MEDDVVAGPVVSVHVKQVAGGERVDDIIELVGLIGSGLPEMGPGRNVGVRGSPLLSMMTEVGVPPGVVVELDPRKVTWFWVPECIWIPSPRL